MKGVDSKMKIEKQEDRVIAFLSGEIDHHSARFMREEIDEQCERTRPKILELDFKGVSFMDSSGIGLVMGRYRTMQQLGGSLRVTNATSSINKVMKLAGLEKLNIFEERK